MQRVLRKINQTEYAYFLEKYTLQDPKYAATMALQTLLTSVKDLPTRMQYWAASPRWGDALRNTEAHRAAIKYLDQWTGFIKKSSSINRYRHPFYQESAQTTLDFSDVSNGEEDEVAYHP